MCGIVCAFDLKKETSDLRPQLLDMSKKIRHRGPDWSGIFSNDNAILSHERLAIVDPKSGKQPLFSQNNNIVLAANGEIYNHLFLKKQFDRNYNFKTKSDCEIILALYEKHGTDFLNQLNGIFAFSIYDIEKDEYFIARDHIGIIPLYMGWDEHGTFYVASELKALEDYCTKIEIFPPGHYLSSQNNKLIKWYNNEWRNYSFVSNNKLEIKKLKESLESAVHRQLMSDVPYGVLLSGGLDSSIIAAIAKKYAKKRIESGDVSDAWWPKLHSFSVGLEGSPDLEAARLVANHIDSIHHEIIFTIQEGIDAINDVIYNLETYDVTTVRASTPMYLMARVIKSMGVKMVLSGEGADEIFGGYLYFHKAPSPKDFHDENVRKLGKLHLYDCLRANKSLAAWGVEGRVPFLDKEFIDVAMNINSKYKMIDSDHMEKWILREAFKDYLPESIVWRQKEQFSDGVGYNWIDTLKEFVNDHVTDSEFENAKYKFPIQTPLTKEEYYYRKVFSSFFPSNAAALTVPSEPSIACSSKVALEWDKSFKNINDPSGRAVRSVHQDKK
ncbi:MAG: asparagine synthase B [Candidatus Marinimicrobia bacterium]|nr:asparagine synthase B [Candidatus Neomarinimicrobiota bacterium]|tara:strand:+ start:2896 stop:4560 length:1665 start_codon:yes stop_codon:yes gene_type:complete